MSTLPLPVLGCDDPPCGACCMAQGGLPVSWYVGCLPYGDRRTLPPELVDELLDILKGWLLARQYPPEGSPCVWFDAAARRCRHYEYRPDVCRDFEVGGGACLMWRQIKASSLGGVA